MHDLLLETRAASARAVTQLAGQLDLDGGKFQACLAQPKTKQRVAAHAALGDRAGVQGTPASLIGRIKDGMLTDARLLSGARTFEESARALDQYANGS